MNAAILRADFAAHRINERKSREIHVELARDSVTEERPGEFVHQGCEMAFCGETTWRKGAGARQNREICADARDIRARNEIRDEEMWKGCGGERRFFQSRIIEITHNASLHIA